MGTNHPVTWSASRWIGARLRCASATICTIFESMVSAPTCVARMVKLPVWLTVPPITGSPALFLTGMGSPLIMDSSMALLPSSSVPSTGTLSPGRTRSRSPDVNSSSGTSRSSPRPKIFIAVGGASSRSARKALDVDPRALSSSTCPSSTRVVITAAAS